MKLVLGTIVSLLLGVSASAAVSSEAQSVIDRALQSTASLDSGNLRGVMGAGFAPLNKLVVESIREGAVDDATAASEALRKLSAATLAQADLMTHIHNPRLARQMDAQDVAVIKEGMSRLESAAKTLHEDLVANKSVDSEVVKSALDSIRRFGHSGTLGR